MMEMQAISWGGRWYATVFVVQNQDITVLVTVTAPERQELQSWLQKRGYPGTGMQLRPRPDHQLEPGYYINPGLKQFYYSVDPESNELTGVPPQEFEPPVPLESGPGTAAAATVASRDAITPGHSGSPDIQSRE